MFHRYENTNKTVVIRPIFTPFVPNGQPFVTISLLLSHIFAHPQEKRYLCTGKKNIKSSIIQKKNTLIFIVILVFRRSKNQQQPVVAKRQAVCVCPFSIFADYQGAVTLPIRTAKLQICVLCCRMETLCSPSIATYSIKQ